MLYTLSDRFCLNLAQCTKKHKVDQLIRAVNLLAR